MKCIACPVPAGRPCHGAALPALCKLARTGDATKLRHVVNRSAIAEGRTPEGQAVPCPEPPTVAESRRRIANAKACPARILDVPCGCSGLARCALGFGKAGTVSLAECIECANPRLTAPAT